MSQTTIDELPDEILTKIVEKLNFKQLLSSTLVCHRWNNVISCSRAFLASAKVAIQINKDLSENRQFSREYSRIKLTYKPEHPHDYRNYIKFILGYILRRSKKSIELELEINFFRTPTEDRSVLKEFPLKINLPKLTKLTLRTGSDWILPNLICPNLEQIFIDRRAWDSIRSTDHITEFLNGDIDKVKIVKLQGIGMNSDELIVPKFKWRTLILTGPSTPPDEPFTENETKNWLSLISASEENATADIGANLGDNLLPYVLNSVTEIGKVEKLIMRFTEANKTNTVESQLAFLTGVHDMVCIKILECYGKSIANKPFIRKCQNIEKLTLNSIENGALEQPDRITFENVKQIHFTGEIKSLPTNFYFPKLENIEFSRFILKNWNTEGIFKRFGTNHQSLIRVKVRVSKESKEELKKIMKIITTVFWSARYYKIVSETSGNVYKKFIRKKLH
jgi:F-box-like